MDFGSGAINDRLALRFPRAKLTDRTKKLVKSQIMDVIRILVKLEIWLSVDEDEVIVEKDGNVIGRINNQIPGKVVPGMHIIANRYDLILN
jgi:phage tail sheath gpL-like